MARTGKCMICKKVKPLTRHHIYKKAVFGENNHIVFICRQCHDRIEFLLRKRENDVLRNKPELYEKAWEDFKRGKRV